VPDLVKTSCLVLDALHPHDGFQRGVVDALVVDATHTGDHAPLRRAGGEQLKRFAVLGPEFSVIGAGVTPLDAYADDAGRFLEAAPVPVASPAGTEVVQFFAAYWAMPF